MEIIARVAYLNNRGIAFEKEGDVTSAITCYEENIKLRWPATHSYERLMVIYKKLKSKEDEVRVIHCAIGVFTEELNRRNKLGIFSDNIALTVRKYVNRLQRVLKSSGIPNGA
jgi:hypothetical protein